MGDLDLTSSFGIVYFPHWLLHNDWSFKCCVLRISSNHCRVDGPLDEP